MLAVGSVGLGQPNGAHETALGFDARPLQIARRLGRHQGVHGALALGPDEVLRISQSLLDVLQLMGARIVLGA
ncbi:hypothetical protein D3C87_1861750 [compost metagenome]